MQLAKNKRALSFVLVLLTTLIYTHISHAAQGALSSEGPSKGMDGISHDKLYEITKNKNPGLSRQQFKPHSPLILLTDAEKLWLQNHINIRLSGPRAFPPFRFLDAQGNNAQGITEDYINLIFNLLQLRPDVQNNLFWPEVLKKAKDKEIDLISVSAKSADREEYLLFTDPYLSFPLVIITKKAAPFIGGIKNLNNTKIAFIEGNVTYNWILKDKINFIPYFVKTPIDALRAVSSGEADASIENLAAATYLILHNGLVNLKIAAPTHYKKYDLHIAVRKDWPELVSILNKALASITPEQHSEILNRWLNVQYEHGIRKNDVIKWTLIVTSIFAVILFIIALWNRRLKREIRERKQVEQTLSESETRFKALHNASFGGIAIHDKGIILECNRGLANMSGYSVAELIGMDGLSIIAEQSRNDVMGKILSGYEKPYEAIGLRKDGVEYPIRLEARKIPYKGKRVRTVEFRDITEQKQAEEENAKLLFQLNQAKKMEAIGLLAGGVAHDLNNILSGIVAYPELLLLQLPKDSALRDPLMAIHESGNRAAAVVDDLLNVARGVARVQEPHNLEVLVQEYLDSPECKKLKSFYPHVIFRHQLGASSPFLVCSPVHIKKTLMNLVTNAAEAIDDEGTVFISTSNKYLDEDAAAQKCIQAGAYVILSIMDSGSGISDEDLKHIFEPFYSKKVMGRSGTGLGLAVVWSTVEEHAGKIFVESNAKGTRFQLYLPVCEESEVLEAKENRVDSLIGNSERILIVDDEPQLRDLASQILQSLTYTVDSVSSGELAIEFMKENSVDLIVLDMLMAPGMSGRKTYEEIVKLYPGQKAIIVSGFSESNDVKATLRLGARGFIKKPYSVTQLANVVKNVLNS